MPTALVGALTGGGLASSIGSMLLNFVVSSIVNKLFGPEEPESPPDQGVSARIPTDPKNKLPVVYGTQRIAGQSIMGDISGNNQKMAFIIALSEGPVEGITEVTWEDKVLGFANTLSETVQDVTTITDLDGNTKARSDAGVPNEGDPYDFLLDGRMKVAVFKDGGDCPPMENFSTRWKADATNRLMPNVAYAYVEIKYNREKRLTGLASRLYFKVVGRKIKTLSEVSGVATLSTAEAHSDSPADCLIDYMTNIRYGCSIPIGSIDLESFLAHKNVCSGVTKVQENVCTFPTGAVTTSGGSTAIIADAYQNQLACEEVSFFVGTTSMTGGAWNLGSEMDAERYTLNGSVNTTNELDKNIADITIGNGGRLTYNLGKFGIISEFESVIAERDGTEVVFSEDNIIGKMDITGAGFDSLLNEVTMKFTSPRQRFQEEQVVLKLPADAPIRNPNEPRLEQTIQLPFTNNNAEAERVGQIILNESRQALIVQFQAAIENTDLQAGDLIRITHDTPVWLNKPFRITQVDEKVLDQDNMAIGVSIVAKEYSSAVYTSGTVLLTDTAPNTNLPNPLVAPILSLITEDASGLDDKGVPKNRISVDWSESIDRTFVESVEVRILKGNNSVDVDTVNDINWEYYTSVGDSIIITEYKNESIEGGTTYQIQARARNTLGALGAFTPINANKSTPVLRPGTTVVIDANGAPVATAPLASIFPIEVNVTSSVEGSVFKNGSASADKTLTATVTTADDAVALADHNTFNYSWEQDGNVVCIDSGKNLINTATIDLSFAGPGTFTQAQCESAGGTFTAGSPPTCTIGGNDIGNAILGCPTGDRADTLNTGFDTSSDKIRSIIVDHTDVIEAAGFSCAVSNIDIA